MNSVWAFPLTITMTIKLFFISIETFTHSYIHDKQWKYGKVKKSWTYLSFPPKMLDRLLSPFTDYFV